MTTKKTSEYFDALNNERLRLLVKKYAIGAPLTPFEDGRLIELHAIVEREVPRVSCEEKFALIETRLRMLETERLATMEQLRAYVRLQVRR